MRSSGAADIGQAGRVMSVEYKFVWAPFGQEHR